MIPDIDDSQFRYCLVNRILEPDIESQNSCSNCLAEGDRKFVRYCSKKCQAEDWSSLKQLCKAIRALPGVEARVLVDELLVHRLLFTRTLVGFGSVFDNTSVGIDYPAESCKITVFLFGFILPNPKSH